MTAAGPEPDRTVPTGPPIAFRAEGYFAKSRFQLFGRHRLRRELGALADAPASLDSDARAHLQQRGAQALLRHLRVRLHVEGLAFLPREPHIIVALHEGVADALLIASLGLRLRVVARAEIFEWPMIGAAMANMRHVPIFPEHGAAAYRRLRRVAETVLAGGEHLLIFPQGALLGIEIAFRCGAFRLAQALGAPILPIVLTGAHRIWEHPFSPIVRYGQRAAIRILPGIPAELIASTEPERLCRELEGRMKAIALSGKLPAPRRYAPDRDGWWDGFCFEIDSSFPDLSAALAARRGAAVGAGSSI